MVVNLISSILRIIVLGISGVITFLLNVGEILGILLTGAFIGILIWSIFDLIFGIFQDRPTQGLNSGLSFGSTIIGFPFIQYFDFMLFSGIVIGLIIAGIWDWQTVSTQSR